MSPDVPSDFYDDAAVPADLYKILRKSEVGNQHVITPAAGYQMYRPYCHGGLPIFTFGNHMHRNPAEENDVIQTMTMGVIEGPVEGTTPTLGDTVYAAHDGTDPYLTVDGADSQAVCCWGIIIDDQRPIHYGEAVLVAPNDTLYSVRMILPSCGTINAIGDS